MSLRILLQLALALPILALALSWWWTYLSSDDGAERLLIGLLLALAAVGLFLAAVGGTTWYRQSRALIVGLLIGSTVATWGVLNGLAAYSTRERLPFTAAAIEAGQPLPGHWLDLTGRLLTEDRIIWDGPRSPETYVPLVNEDWKAGTPIAVFFRAKEENWGEPGRLLTHKEAVVTGLVQRRGLPNQVRDLFNMVERPAAETAIVLDYEAKPGPQLMMCYVGVGVGLAIALGAVLFGLRKSSAPP